MSALLEKFKIHLRNVSGVLKEDPPDDEALRLINEYQRTFLASVSDDDCDVLYRELNSRWASYTRSRKVLQVFQIAEVYILCDRLNDVFAICPELATVPFPIDPTNETGCRTALDQFNKCRDQLDHLYLTEQGVWGLLREKHDVKE